MNTYFVVSEISIPTLEIGTYRVSKYMHIYENEGNNLAQNFFAGRLQAL